MSTKLVDNSINSQFLTLQNFIANFFHLEIQVVSLHQIKEGVDLIFKIKLVNSFISFQLQPTKIIVS